MKRGWVRVGKLLVSSRYKATTGQAISRQLAA